MDVFLHYFTDVQQYWHVTDNVKVTRAIFQTIDTIPVWSDKLIIEVFVGKMKSDINLTNLLPMCRNAG